MRLGIASEVAIATLHLLPEKQSAVHALINRSFLSDAANARSRRIFDDRLLKLKANGAGNR